MHDLVRIEWTDSRGPTPRWQFIEDLDEGPCIMESVGWIVADREDHIIIAAHVGADGQVSGAMYVPKVAILHTHYLSKRIKAVAA